MNPTPTSHPVPRPLRAFSILIIAVLTLICFTSCAKYFRNPEDKQAPLLPVKTLTKDGLDAYNRGQYYDAIEKFNKILDNYRFSDEAILAELKVADSNYYLKNYTEAIGQYKKFEEMHPTNEAIPYVMYQKAMCNYKQIDRIDTDTTGAFQSIKIFNQLLKAYPNSPYTEDATEKIRLAKEFLADHEFCIAKFYLRTHKKEAAIARLNYLLTMYPQADIAEQARKLLEETPKNK